VLIKLPSNGERMHIQLLLAVRGQVYRLCSCGSKAQQKETQRLISDKMPDQVKLPFALWTRKAVSLLIRERYGVVLAERTMSEYMKRWGFTAQKPMHRAFEQRPAEVLKWKEQTYPAQDQIQKVRLGLHHC
jgi:hypothetical protein